jgi:hypothetical protein
MIAQKTHKKQIIFPPLLPFGTLVDQKFDEALTFLAGLW